MKKFLEKVKKGLFTVGLFLITLPTKVLADVVVPTVQPMYGVQKAPSVNVVIWNILKVAIVPLMLVIGLITFWFKSKSNTKRKVITILLMLLMIALFCKLMFGMFAIMNYARCRFDNLVV